MNSDFNCASFAAKAESVRPEHSSISSWMGQRSSDIGVAISSRLATRIFTKSLWLLEIRSMWLKSFSEVSQVIPGIVPIWSLFILAGQIESEALMILYTLMSDMS